MISRGSSRNAESGWVALGLCRFRKWYQQAAIRLGEIFQAERGTTFYERSGRDSATIRRSLSANGWAGGTTARVRRTLFGDLAVTSLRREIAAREVPHATAPDHRIITTCASRA